LLYSFAGIEEAGDESFLGAGSADVMASEGQGI